MERSYKIANIIIGYNINIIAAKDVQVRKDLLINI